MKSGSNIKVLLAEDHMVVREGLRLILDAEKSIEVVGEAVNGRQAVQMTKRLHPDVVVMDIAMPVLNGLEAIRQIHETMPEVKVIVLSAHSDDAYVEKVISLGASGYLIKQTSAHLLSDAIRKVQDGGTFLSPVVAKRYGKRHAESLNRKGLPSKKAVTLTSRELEVVQLIAEGSANKQIADVLGISIKTVEKHRDHLMQKLDIHDTAGLTRYAIEAGIIESSIQSTTL